MSSRTPFIAGNWKMNKTIAEAEAYIAALLPQVYDTEGVDVAICPPFLALQAMVDSARGSRVGVYAQTMHEADVGRVHRRGVGADADRARRQRRRARALRAAPVLQRDRPGAPAEGAEGARGRPGADPLRRRDRGGARARRHRAQAPPPGPGGPRQGADRAAARGRDRLRARVGDRHGADRHERAGAGRVRLRARARGGLRQGGRPGRARPLRRLAEARERRGAARRCPTSTAG